MSNNAQIDPLKVTLLDVPVARIKKMNEITETMIFTPSTKNFSPSGLYSTEIFGLPGSTARSNRIAYIDLKQDLIHPTVFKLLIKARSLYKDICKGTKYAIFSPKLKDFVESDHDKAETGYGFFLRHIDKLVVEDSGSATRDILNKLLNKFRSNLTLRHLIVIPAGMRDYSEDEEGAPTTDEINVIYRKILSGAKFTINGDGSGRDVVSFGQQQNLQELSDYIDNLLFGKKKFINKRFLRRAVHFGTRTVATSQLNDFTWMNAPSMTRTDQTTVGLFQYLKGTILRSTYDISNGWFKEVFPSDESNMNLVDIKTLKSVSVPMDTKFYRKYMTHDGLNKQINTLFSKENRIAPITFNDKYFVGLYYDDNNKVYLGQDIDDFPDFIDKNKIQPLTLFLIAYLATYSNSTHTPCIPSRYPVLKEGGTFPSFVYLRATSKVKVVDVIQPRREPVTYHSYPMFSTGFFNSMSLDSIYMDGLGLDFDGDKCSVNMLITKESEQEITKVLSQAKFYLSVSGTMQYSASEAISDISLKTFTKE